MDISTTTRPTFRCIAQADYPMVLSADSRLYPTATPVQRAAIQQWYSKHPSFGIIFEDTVGNTVGSGITVAMTPRGWEALTRGEVSESEIHDDLLFDNGVHDELAIHVYHVEKESGWHSTWPRISIMLLHALAKVMAELSGERAPDRPRLRVSGFSGLAVSPSGINLFSNTYNCKERADYICDEFIMRKPQVEGPPAIEVIEGMTQQMLSELLLRGREFLTRAKMLVLLPDDTSIVWHELRQFM